MDRATQSEDVPVIAIQPFVAAPTEQQLEDAAADLQEQLSLRLSRRTGIHVLSLDESSVGVATYILRGRVRIDRDMARLTLSLVLYESGRLIWSDTYKDKANNLLGLIDKSVERADADLRLAINKLDAERFSHIPDDALSASELRARAAHCFYLVTEKSYEQSVHLLERSLQLAPDNPMANAMWAYSQTALMYARFTRLEQKRLDEIVARAYAAAQADPRSDFVAKVRAEVTLKISNDIEGAKRACERARKINPNYALLKTVEIEVALAEGAWQRASELCATYMEQHANNDDLPYVLYMNSVAMLLAEQFEGAADSLEQAIELRPSCRRFWHLLSEIHKRSGNRASEERAKATMARLPDSIDILASELVLPEGQMDLMQELAPSSDDTGKQVASPIGT